MTQINISETVNQVRVTGEGDNQVITVSSPGAQGPAGAGWDFDGTGKVDKSLVYYKASVSSFVADSSYTPSTITAGGNFYCPSTLSSP